MAARKTGLWRRQVRQKKKTLNSSTQGADYGWEGQAPSVDCRCEGMEKSRENMELEMQIRQTKVMYELLLLLVGRSNSVLSQLV